MSSDQPRVVESRPSALTSNPVHEAEDEKDHGTVERPLEGDQIRGVIRLIQCRKCSHLLQEPITLPCGRSLCKQCVPETHTRENISYPATPNRLQGFECPYVECGKNHAVGDCGVDVILTKAVNNFKSEMEKAKETSTKAEISTHVIINSSGAEQSDMRDDNAKVARVVKGGPLLAVYTLADTGELDYNSAVTFAEVSSLGDEATSIDSRTFSKVKESVRTEMDCQTFWADAVLTRGDALAAEAMNRHREFDIPIFVCTLSFPMMPTFLHVFEPRYRLMIRRALEGDRTFGMVLPQRPRTANDTHFVQYGTLLRIVNAEYFADGRSLIETSGISRFRITRHGILDGYLVGKIERIDDISIAEEEDLEATETQHALERYESAATHQSEDSSLPRPLTTTPEDLSTMPTSDLLSLGVSFVQRMRQQSVPWLAQRMLAIYGECPNDPALFPWWFASILPAKEYEKYKLLETRSVRERLKICCGWILEWESSRCFPAPIQTLCKGSFIETRCGCHCCPRLLVIRQLNRRAKVQKLSGGPLLTAAQVPLRLQNLLMLGTSSATGAEGLAQET
ncbi:ATP-dependent protease La domain-containing protein [Colletotrichum paranaense]|uniref:ATP-dependent protease La domain-containing protein n=1 Tax=Colletotrichum paranaense TaxID=1914294 RepID=A0ABQ9SG01_9PEZI|nr:ATP-dependent protease La domain-containing protein [Colletotrichum paranaense]KAK1535594.1 ATP-dependent protease La domain-containing protein [Colletotrichum paranaense]